MPNLKICNNACLTLFPFEYVRPRTVASTHRIPLSLKIWRTDGRSSSLTIVFFVREPFCILFANDSVRNATGSHKIGELPWKRTAKGSQQKKSQLRKITDSVEDGTARPAKKGFKEEYSTETRWPPMHDLRKALLLQQPAHIRPYHPQVSRRHR